MPVATIGERLTDWRNSNPLRVWRVEQGMSMRAMAGLLSRSASTVQAWEYGSSEPPFDYVASHMKITTATLERRWKQWIDERPET